MIKKMAGVFIFLVLNLSAFKPVAQEANQPIVRNINAKTVSQSHIQIQWKLPKDFSASTLLVFRDTQPIATKAQLDSNKPIAEIKGTSNYYLDALKNYKTYYYAVIAKTADGKRYDLVLPSINATVLGAHLEKPAQDALPDPELSEEKLYADGQKRELPLPYLNMLSDQDKKPNKLKPEVMQAGAELAGSYAQKKHEPLPPHIFDEDMISPVSGDEYYLFEILKTSFIKRDYAEAVTALQTFLGVNRSQEVTTRAAFYLGEALYYCGRYRQALMMFLYVEEDESALCKKWIQSTLDLYTVK